MFVNNTFFPTAETKCQRFDFVDSLTIEFVASQNFGNGTINYKYLFRFNNIANKWQLEYAEKKECTTEQSIYYFTDYRIVDSLHQGFSMANFSTEKARTMLFTNVNNGVFCYKYKRKHYLDSIEYQISKMRLSNVSSFKNIFTIDHAEEILQDYPVHKTHVTFLNKIAYYLEQMSITMPAIIILEMIVADYPDRTVSYLNLSDALSKNRLKIKAEKIYQQYSKLMKIKGKHNEIPQRVFSITD
jgi:uncharacterized protein YeeX (DUF496 family)